MADQEKTNESKTEKLKKCDMCHKEFARLFRTWVGTNVCAMCLITPVPRGPGCPTAR